MTFRKFARFALLASACALAQQQAFAAGVTTSQAWVRWLPGDLPAAGYMTLTNDSPKPVELLSASSPDYDSVMLHQSVSNGSTSRMIDVDKVAIPPHGTVAIAPGGYHFMLEKARRKLAPGDKVRLDLKFSDGETLAVPMDVRAPTSGH